MGGAESMTTKPRAVTRLTTDPHLLHVRAWSPVNIATAMLSFAAVAGLLTIIPGLDTALVLRAAITNGRRHAFATALGVINGTLIWGAAAATGASILLTASHLA